MKCMWSVFQIKTRDVFSKINVSKTAPHFLAKTDSCKQTSKADTVTNMQ